jgi:hypothetical protein
MALTLDCRKRRLFCCHRNNPTTIGSGFRKADRHMTFKRVAATVFFALSISPVAWGDAPQPPFKFKSVVRAGDAAHQGLKLPSLRLWGIPRPAEASSFR